MAGLAYIYQGNTVSFDDPKYIDSEFATSKLLMSVSGAPHYHGFTSDRTASEYCPLVFNVSGTKARIGQWKSRSRAFTDDEYREVWSGTGYVSRTRTYRKTNPAGTYHQGGVSSQTSKYYSTSYQGQRLISYSYVSNWENPVAVTTMMSNNPTGSSLATNTHSERDISNTYGYNPTFYTYSQSESSNTYSNMTGSSKSWRRSTVSYASVKYGTNQMVVEASTTYSSSCKMYTFGELATVEMPEWYETQTITEEFLHNYNV